MHGNSVTRFVPCLHVRRVIERCVWGLKGNILFDSFSLPEKETSVNHKQGFFSSTSVIYKLHQFTAGDQGRDIKLLL